MIQFTTPAVTLTLKGATLSASDNVWVSIRQRRRNDWVGPDIKLTSATVYTSNGVTTISFSLTQAQTAQLVPGEAMIQVNWMTSTGKRGATNPATINITRNLLDEVLVYE